MSRAFFPFIVLIVISYLFVYIIRRWALHRQIIDIPNQRSSHKAPTPRGGGLAISILVILTGLVTILSGGSAAPIKALTYLGCATAVSALGFVDDIYHLSSKVRFGLQGLIALVTIVGVGYFDQLILPVFGTIPLYGFGILLTLLWIVGLINAYNFMDGSDGLAGGVAFCAGVGWALMISSSTDGFILWICIAISACVIGFLGHNWSPAKIFMGDVGSTFLGYSFAVIPLFLKDQIPQSATVAVFILWVFIFDTGFTLIRRWRRHENLMTAHRSHLYQRLIISGRSHIFIAVSYMILTVCGAIAAYSIVVNKPDSGVAILASLSLLGLAIGLWATVQLAERNVRSSESSVNA